MEAILFRFIDKIYSDFGDSCILLKGIVFGDNFLLYLFLLVRSLLLVLLLLYYRLVYLFLEVFPLCYESQSPTMTLLPLGVVVLMLAIDLLVGEGQDPVAAALLGIFDRGLIVAIWSVGHFIILFSFHKI